MAVKSLSKTKGSASPRKLPTRPVTRLQTGMLLTRASRIIPVCSSLNLKNRASIRMDSEESAKISIERFAEPLRKPETVLFRQYLDDNSPGKSKCSLHPKLHGPPWSGRPWRSVNCPCQSRVSRHRRLARSKSRAEKLRPGVRSPRAPTRERQTADTVSNRRDTIRVAFWPFLKCS